jgi:hypothetical protein
VNQFNQDAEVKRQHELFREAGQAVDTKDPIHIFSELSVPERLLVSALSYLLQSTSSNIKTPGGIDYYMGNLPGERLPYNIGNKGEIQTATWPKITATWYEMAKAMGGGELSGGQSIRNVKKHLEKLAGKKHIVHQYKRTKDGSSIEVRTTSPLILIFERTSIRKEKGKVAESVTIGLSPIFRDQIGTYYLNRPGDYLQRLYQAHGGRKVPMATVSLIDYLSARLMHKESKHKIGVVKLREKLGLSATYKPGRILAEIERAITAGKAVGLIDACHQEQGVAGEILFCFDLNLKWGHSEKK